MKLLLDECTPKRLKREFINHECWTVDDAGFKGLENGELLKAASDYDVLVTVDRKLVREDFSELKIASKTLGYWFLGRCRLLMKLERDKSS